MAAAMASPVAFSLSRVSSADVAAPVAQLLVPSTTALVTSDPRMLELLPLPWHSVVLTDGSRAHLVREGHVQRALYDALWLPRDFIESNNDPPWMNVRIAPSAISRLLDTAVTMGLPIRTYTSMEDFLKELYGVFGGGECLTSLSLPLLLTSRTPRTPRTNTWSGVSSFGFPIS
eukprot:TRINITY_DN2634_c0_g1_i2.p1 TRINITY_DN2634_c0_g1~~TRINITY_DN2634_c0_g1_i2.p1  ORF type:complete len:174 (-),score=13.05 TRINITY_DN2634_c0_g1_i2:442-963(-)